MSSPRRIEVRTIQWYA